MAGLKAPMEGVVDRDGIPSNASYRPAGGPVRAWVYGYGGHQSLYWSELEPTQGTLNSTVMADLVSKLNQAVTDGYTDGVKLRILCGVNAPSWAKTAFGSAIVDTSTGGVPSEATCVLWWMPAATAAYVSLMARLAAQLDGHPALRDVAMSWGGIQGAEPLIRKVNSAVTTTGYTSRVNLWNAFVANVGTLSDRAGRRYYQNGSVTDDWHGARLSYYEPGGRWSPARHYGLVGADRAAVLEGLRGHSQYWVKTPTSLAVNPYQQIVKGTDGVVYGTIEDVAADTSRPYRTFTLDVMDRGRSLLRQRLVLGNNSIRYTPPASGSGSDNFERADSAYGSGWGTASGGGSYTGTNNADTCVLSGTGALRQNAANSQRRVRHTATKTGSTRSWGQLSWTVSAAGAEHWIGIELLVQDVLGSADGYVQLQIREAASGSNRWKWRFRIQDSVSVSAAPLPTDGAVEYTLGTYTPGHAIGWVCEVESIDDSTLTLRGKVWDATVGGEPADWQIELGGVSTPDLANWAGHFGIRCSTSAGYTATTNVFQVDQWQCVPMAEPPTSGVVGGPAASARYARIYQQQAELGGPLYYQTAAPAKLPNANWSQVMEWASTSRSAVTSLGQHGQGASYVELPASYDGDGGYSAWTI